MKLFDSYCFCISLPDHFWLLIGYDGIEVTRCGSSMLNELRTDIDTRFAKKKEKINRKKTQHDPTPPSKLIALSNSKLNSLPHTNDFKSQGLRSEGFLIPFMEMKYHSFIKQTLFPFMLITEKKGALLSYASRFSLAAFSLHYTAVPTQCPTAD